jgi:hypothetical protein
MSANVPVVAIPKGRQPQSEIVPEASQLVASTSPQGGDDNDGMGENQNDLTSPIHKHLEESVNGSKEDKCEREGTQSAAENMMSEGPSTGKNAGLILNTEEERRAFIRRCCDQLDFFQKNKQNQSISQLILNPHPPQKDPPHQMRKADRKLQNFLHHFTVFFVCGVRQDDAPQHVTAAAARLEQLPDRTITFTMYIAKNSPFKENEFEFHYANRILERVGSSNPHGIESQKYPSFEDNTWSEILRYCDRRIADDRELIRKGHLELDTGIKEIEKHLTPDIKIRLQNALKVVREKLSLSKEMPDVEMSDAEKLKLFHDLIIEAAKFRKGKDYRQLRSAMRLIQKINIPQSGDNHAENSSAVRSDMMKRGKREKEKRTRGTCPT